VAAVVVLFTAAAALTASLGIAGDAAPNLAAGGPSALLAPSTDAGAADALLPPGYRNPRSAEQAVQWALGQVGIHRDAGHCLRFVNLAYGRASGPPSAFLVWTRSNAALHHFTHPAPRGAIVVWSNAIGGGHGHVGISLGNGRMVSTTGGPIAILQTRGFADSAYFGWMPPYFYM
jgi:hypothetical protein